MKIEELYEDKYSPKLSIHLDGVKESDIAEIAGMLRGLKCAIEGWGGNSGLTNDVFVEEKYVRLIFKSVENAHYFKSCVEYYFDDHILEALKIKKRVYRN